MKGEIILKQFECAIIGGGAAGLSAGLYLGLSLRKTVIFDNGTNRNRVTKKSHGYLTRDGVTPHEFKHLAMKDIQHYDNVKWVNQAVKNISKTEGRKFLIHTENGAIFEVSKIILSTGVQEVFPNNMNVSEFYGKSMFSCPYCDGWEVKNQPLIVIAESDEHAIHLGKLVYNWSKNIIIASNGHQLKDRTIEWFQQKGIEIIESRITKLCGDNGMLKAVEFDSGMVIERTGGFISPTYKRTNDFAEKLGCEINEHGHIVTDGLARTSEPNIYVAGECKNLKSTSLSIAGAEGSQVAKTVNMDIINENF